MVKGRVSVIIAGRTEKYFQKTVESTLASATGDIEIIAIVDGDEIEPYVNFEDSRVKIIRLEKSIGQRAAYNLGVRESTGEYVMKIDAHCLLSKGFDEALKSSCGPKTVVLPEMRRLDVQKWAPKRGGETHFMYFGLDLYCHYWPQYKSRSEAQVEYPEVLTGQGSCWFCTREWNNYIGLLDEKVGSWGNVGIEISLRTWLQGGSQIVNKKVWQAHYFRKDEGGFPYPMNGRNVARAHKYTWNNYYFKDDAFKNQVRPFRWLMEKFAPIPGWEAYMVDSFKSPRVIVYYTDSNLDPKLANAVRKRLKKVCGPIPIISVSQKSLAFGKNVVVGDRPKIYKSVYEALLTGVKSAPEGSIIYLCEHDVFYHPSHFAFLPPEKGTLFFNTNRYYYNLGKDTFLATRGRRTLSQCVAFREDIIKHAEERLSNAGEDITERWENWEKRSVLKCRNFESNRPNVDILHGGNLTLRGHYKNRYVKGKEKGDVTNLPGWGGPKHFCSISGYKMDIVNKPIDMDNADVVVKKTEQVSDPKSYLHHKYNNGQVSPVRVPRMKRNPTLAKLFDQFGFKVGAEIGVKRGRFSEVFCRDMKCLEKYYAIDPWMEYWEVNNQKVRNEKANAWYQDACRRLNKYHFATVVRKTSEEASKYFDDNSLDFVYIDANHSFDYIMQDLILWGRKVRPGGIISGHDYFRFRNAGVVPAVDVYTQQHQVQEWFITDEKEASFFWVKG